MKTIRVYVASLGKREVRLALRPGTVLKQLTPRYVPRENEARVNSKSVRGDYVLQDRDLVMSVPTKIVGCNIKGPHTHWEELESYMKGKSLQAFRDAKERMLNTKIVEGVKLRG